MSLVVVGSIAFDSVKTPFGEVDEVLGGLATYFSTSASYFTEVSLVAVVGTDFPDKHLKFLKSRKIDIEGIEKVECREYGNRNGQSDGHYESQISKKHPEDDDSQTTAYESQLDDQIDVPLHLIGRVALNDDFNILRL